MKRFLIISLVCIAIFWTWVIPSEAGIIEVYFTEQNTRYTLYTLNQDEAEYVHLNKVSQLFQMKMDIEPLDGQVVLASGDKTISFYPDQPQIVVNRRAYFVDLPPRKFEGVIMLPLQFLTDILPMIYEGDITWDPGRRILQVGIKDFDITNLYTSPYGDYTRIVVEMNRSVPHKVTEKLPSLLIVNLPKSRATGPQNVLQVNNRGVQQVRVIDSFGTTQIMVRLGPDFDRYKLTPVENPPRLLIDVYTRGKAVVEPIETPAISALPEATSMIQEQDLTQEAGQTGLTTSKKFALQTVVIDPGHGGSDRGVSLPSQTADTPGLFEKDVTLNIAKLLATSLTQRLGVRVILTRQGDDFIPAGERTTIANNNRADVLISLHVNNSASPALSGFEAYVMDYGGFELPAGYEEVSAQSQLLDYAQARYLDQSTRLANQILAAYEARSTKKAGILRNAPLFTLRGATMPAVHIEIGYNSNNQDQAQIIQDSFQQMIVAIITDGIAAFKKQEE
jgi:N-acetylmuramoyl-L-alanine amidase